MNQTCDPKPDVVDQGRASGRLPGNRPALPFRAKFLFVLTLFMVCFCVGLRVLGFQLSRWERILVDGPTLTFVAFSSLVRATYKNLQAEQPPASENPEFVTTSSQPTNTSEASV